MRSCCFASRVLCCVNCTQVKKKSLPKKRLQSTTTPPQTSMTTTVEHFCSYVHGSSFQTLYEHSIKPDNEMKSKDIITYKVHFPYTEELFSKYVNEQYFENTGYSNPEMYEEIFFDTPKFEFHEFTNTGFIRKFESKFVDTDLALTFLAILKQLQANSILYVCVASSTLSSPDFAEDSGNHSFVVICSDELCLHCVQAFEGAFSTKYLSFTKEDWEQIYCNKWTFDSYKSMSYAIVTGTEFKLCFDNDVKQHFLKQRTQFKNKKNTNPIKSLAAINMELAEMQAEE